MIFAKAHKKSWGMKNYPLKTIPKKTREVIENPFPDWKFSKLDFHYLSYGFIPDSMDDKWFSYMDENNVFRNYRSWSNILIDEFHFEKKGNIYYIKKRIYNTSKNSFPGSSFLINQIIKFNKEHLTLCSYCFKQIEKGERTIMKHGAGYKKKDDKKITGYSHHYHHFCYLKKYPESQFDKSIR